ncbi:hypothetical protein GQ53DRAFT_836264 [Thozetella sp. PMI_491]|nr:hypothetical protein GQ53DRAFT_836264 [Thozetella sp. PMI_491]
MPVPVGLPILVPIQTPRAFGSRTPLWPRDDHKTSNANTIVIAAVVVGILVLLAAIVVVRTIRARHPNPKYIPTPFLKRIWSGWNVPRYRTGYQAAGDDDDVSTRRTSRLRAGSESAEGALADAGRGSRGNGGVAGVDRNTSVRSVMTLPAYRSKAAETEQVLGREGERDGIDVVVEMPTAEDEEALRDEEMEALYQIRLTRRRQIAEREELRQARRGARQRHDVVALDELRRQARLASESNVDEVEGLRREHERIKETRQRAVSSVSYGDLGVARADGTRLRANSTESERVGLLSDAASIAQSLRSPSRTGSSSLLTRRDRRASSVMSIDTARSNDRPDSPGLMTGESTYSLHSAGRARSRANSGANSGANTPRLSSSNTRAGSSPEIIDAEEGDLGESDMPPPGYDDVSLDDITPVHSRSSLSGRNSPYNEPPPDYPGPSQARNNRLSAHMEDLAAEAATDDDGQSTRSKSSLPQLPSLRLHQLPQIVIEPSSAQPRDTH